MLAELMFRPFEALLNRGLGASNEAQTLATGLEGRSLGLRIEGTPFDARLRIADRRFTVALPDGSIPDASLSGGPIGMSRLLGRDPQAAIRDGSVHVTGDTEIAARFRELLHLAAPHLEREIARFFGEPLAREFSDAQETAARWGKEAGEKVAQQVSQYLREDARLVPSTSELAGFTHDVDTLVNDVECAEARIRRLKNAL